MAGEPDLEPAPGRHDPEASFYGDRLAKHGPTPQGVGWNSTRAQEMRFFELLKVCDGVEGPISINDYGCGYGALYEYLRRRGGEWAYAGFDISARMIEEARGLYGDTPGATVTTREEELEPADFTVGSGLFGQPFETAEEEWRDYVIATIDRLAKLSKRGFAFNMLTTYSDSDRMRDELYYADPSFFFDHCMRRYSRRVALLHHYELYDFTIHVLLDERHPPPSEAP